MQCSVCGGFTMFPPTCAKCEREQHAQTKRVEAAPAHPQAAPAAPRFAVADVHQMLRLGEDVARNTARFALAMRAIAALEILAALVIGARAIVGAMSGSAADDLTQATTFAGHQLSLLVAVALLLAGIYTMKSPRAGILAQVLVGVLLTVVVPILRGG